MGIVSLMTRLEMSDFFDATVDGSVTVVCGSNPIMAGWRFVTFAAVDVASGTTISVATGDTEMAIVPLNGHASVHVNGAQFDVRRSDVFAEKGSIVYVPPKSVVRIDAHTAVTLGMGSAPAEERYDARLLDGANVRVEMRGGGAARRQVTHLLSPPIEAHRLIVYEVLVPRGSWSGWPPHCHDGLDGSPYLEETYYFEHRPANGFGIHRNFRESAGLDDVFVVPHRSLITVPAGYHSSAASPGSHMYFLNVLAGDLVHEDRRTPPCFDERYVWIDGHWDDDPLTLPS